MVTDTKSISSLTALIKTLEEEIRNIRQRLENVERAVKIEEWGGIQSIQSSDQLQKINSVSKEILDTIESAKLYEADPLKLLVIPEVPVKIVEIKKILNQLDKKTSKK